VRWTSGSSGEQRRGIASIPAKGSQRLDQSGSEGWRGGEEAPGRWDLGGVERPRRISASSSVVGLVVARKKERARVGLYRGASLCRREGGREQTRGRAQADGRRRRAPRACMAAARHRRLDVAGQGKASRGSASGGRSSQATRRTRESGIGAAGPRENGR
jgi:hypothetical protein